MKRFEIPMVVTCLTGLCFLAGLDVPVAHADFTFGEPVNARSTFPLLNPENDGIDCFSADGREMYIESRRSGGYGLADLWVCKRASVGDDWGPPENLGPLVNGASWDLGASISADGLELYFHSNRPGGYGYCDLYVTKRASRTSPWGPPTNLGPKVNRSSDDEALPSVSSDGLELYFISNRAGGYGGMDLYVSKRATTNDPWGDPVNLGPGVNSPAYDGNSSLSPEGMLMFFESGRPGGSGGWEIYMARRAAKTDPWGPAMNAGPVVNSSSNAGQSCPRVSFDGSTLYFISDRPGSYTSTDIWQAPITPVVDFNSDGKVEAADMAILLANWGKNTPLCDIGPFPWGDGIVDERDLKALMAYLMAPGPKASDVPCDVMLRWISPSFAQACDVYFGTSFEAVNTAGRTDPQGVLVSQGQTTTTYSPPGLLDYGRTYYWRVDFVISGPMPIIYAGSVLSFTIARNPIKNVIATASSVQPNMGSEKTIDGSGLDKNDAHSTNGADMWLSTGTQPNWIQYQFDQAYALQELWVWNSNQPAEPRVGFGAKTVKIEYSTDGTKWTQLANVPEFARAPGQPGYLHNTTVNFGGVSAKYVKLTIEKGWSAAGSVGLSEVRFFCLPDRSATKP